MATNIAVLTEKVDNIDEKLERIEDYPVIKERLNTHIITSKSSAKKGYAIITVLSTIIAAAISALSQIFS